MDTPAPLALDQSADHSVEQWEKAAAAVLRKSGQLGESDPDTTVWQALSTRTLDGIDVTVLGTPAQVADLAGAARPARAAVGAWDVRAGYAETDPAELNRAALVDLENGVNSLWLRGTAQATPDLAVALQGVLLDVAPVILQDIDPAGFVALLGDQRPAPAANLGADPVGASVRGVEPVADLLGTATAAETLGCLGVVVDGTAVHDLGASDAQELGYLLACGAHYLRQLTGADANRSVAQAAALIELRVAVTDEQFVSIAKLRALRRLWSRVLEISGAAGAPERIHAVTSRPMMSKYDPWVNMLRTTVAAFAAGVGGADAVTVLPFDSPLGRPDGFGRRIARNTSALLIEESHLARVTDPAGGSFAVERLTADLAAAAWAEFGTLETERAVSDGAGSGLDGLRARIRQVVAVRNQEIAERKRPITGLTEFPNLGETLPERAASAEPAVRAYGAAFEAMRDEPIEQPVFLATLGPVASHTARATFASNLLAAGGIAVASAGATNGTDELIAAFREHPSPVVCLAGHDRSYADWGAAAIAELRAAGARHVIVAGKALDDTDDACAMGVDALAFLTRTREELSK